MHYSVDERGFYGDFGGAFIPEMLHANIEELRQRYLEIMAEPDFQEEMQQLLKNYVGRPTPLYFARRLSRHYGSNIYLKREDLNHTGAHKINNTIGQILLAKRLGKTRIIAETGAGQHGVATATVCALMGLECIVYMGAIDIGRQAPNVSRMKMLGARVVPATSGSKTLKDATNEAIRDWINNPVDTHYIIGSVVGPHPYPDMVARFQAVISEEMKWQLKEQTGAENPDIIIACVGGGSNAAGAYYHYLEDPSVRLVAVEAAGLGIDSGESAATSVLGTKGIIHGSRTLLMQTADGQIIEPYSISAGLDYPGIGPMHSNLIVSGRAEAISITDEEALEAAFLLTRLEGIIPALESAHAFAAMKYLKYTPQDHIVINLSGRGDKDLSTYIKKIGIVNRIDQLFQSKKEEILNIYFTAGYPKLDDTEKIILHLDAAGVDIVEIGMPYSDPMADGPTIQESGSMALKNGMTLDILFSQLENIRSKTQMPLLFMGYLNQMMQYGVDHFLQSCVDVGIDGLIIPDLPVDIYELELKEKIEASGLHIIFLITPQTSATRVRKIDDLARGFIYMVSNASITGAKSEITQAQLEYFDRINGMNLKNPRLIGFGISNHETFSQACRFAQGAIVGSAFIKHIGSTDQNLEDRIGSFVQSLRGRGVLS